MKAATISLEGEVYSVLGISENDLGCILVLVLKHRGNVLQLIKVDSEKNSKKRFSVDLRVSLPVGASTMFMKDLNEHLPYSFNEKT